MQQTPVTHRSVSQLNTYSCGLRYYLGRIRKVPRTPAAWTIQGSAVHSAVEMYEKSLRTAPEWALVDRYRETWQRLKRNALLEEPNLDAWMTGGRKKARKDIEDRFALGQEQITKYLEYAKHDPLRVWTLPDSGLPASEVKFLEDFGGVQVLGYVDLIMEDPVTGELQVRDIKTGTQKPIGLIQLAVYRWAIKKKYGRDLQWGDYWMAKYGAPSEPIYLGNTSLKQVESRFQMMDFAESNGIYLPNEGAHCRICDVSRYCPYMGGAAPEGIYFLGT